jgi:two-component system phosphate regulon response regulator PhoB
VYPTGVSILIADDEPDVLAMVTTSISAAGFYVVKATDGAEALEKARSLMPALIVLDVMMPGIDGFELTRILKADPKTAAISIVMLTAKAEELDRVLGFELGVDDYVTKPFSPRELVLRIKSILKRRAGPLQSATFVRVGAISIDREVHRVHVRGADVHLTAIEFKLLSALMEKPGRVLSRETLLDIVWGFDSEIEARTVDTHLRRLRDKLGEAAEQIQTVRGFGYRIEPAQAEYASS